ncbi:bactofilin family protein [Arsenophonus symbiont of Ornithomya chloropus]|uniref:bactofilin family protein n=1 Tax=Arsenophonus symbiont of Ornithomya chloropus TaxID=634121 RepID=UPI0032B2A6CA
MRLINVAIITWCLSIIMYFNGFFWISFGTGLISSFLIIYYFRRNILFKKKEIEDIKNKKKKIENDKKTIICSETCFTGDIISDSDIFIDGKYVGNIFCKENTVIITKNGMVTGSILAKKIIIHGKIDGRVESNVIQIQLNGIIEGEIFSENLSIEDGGFFIGTSKKITLDLNKKIPEFNDFKKDIQYEKKKINIGHSLSLKENPEKKNLKQ